MITFRSRQTGVSITEVMVSLVATLIVSGAVLTFTTANVRSNSQNIQATRLSQELRNVMDLVTRELKRAGYDGDAIGGLGRGSGFVSPFARVLVDADADCVVYAYDRPEAGKPEDGDLDLGNNEVRGVRFVADARNGLGAVEFNDGRGGAVPACNDAGGDYSVFPPACSAAGWCPVTDPRTIDIVAFDLDLVEGDPDVAGATPMLLRKVTISLQGRLSTDNSVARGMESEIRIRADCLRADLADCRLAPGA